MQDTRRSELDTPTPSVHSSFSLKRSMSDFRRVRDTVPWRLWMVAVIGFWERAAFWGLLAPWQNYMEKPPAPDGQQTLGALGLGQALATRIYCCFYIFYYVSPIFIAIIADSKLGHFTSLVTSVVLYCLGILALVITSIPANIAKGWGVPGLVVAMFLIGLGGGGVKAILPAFLADQYTKKEPQLKKLKTGETVVTDYDLTLQYIYNLYFWIGNVGSLSWFGTVYIEKRYGFAEAYGFTLGPMVIALLMLVLGKKWYLQVPHKDNLIVPQATKIVACAARHEFKMKRTYPDYQFEHRHKLVSWDSNMVAELTRGLRGCRVLLVFVTFWVCFDQMQNNLISQAGQMKTDSTPNDLLPALNQVGCIILSPLIQMVLYPLLHRRRIYIGPIMRITIGFGFMALAMLYATVVQHFIYSTATCFENTGNCSAAIEQHNRPSVWIQAPIYFLISIGEIFSYVTGLEYAYDHSPKDMKVIVQAINLLVAGAGSAVALALSAVAHDPNLVIFYASLTGAMTVTTIGFWLVFRNYDKDHMHPEQQKPKERNMSEVESGYHQEEDRVVAAGGTNDDTEKLPPTIVVAHDTSVPSKL